MHHWQYQFSSDLEVLSAHFLNTPGNQLYYHVLKCHRECYWLERVASKLVCCLSEPQKEKWSEILLFCFSKPSRNFIFLKLMWSFFRTKLAFLFSYFQAKRKMLSPSFLEVISEQWPYRWFLKTALLRYNSYNVWLINLSVLFLSIYLNT